MLIISILVMIMVCAVCVAGIAALCSELAPQRMDSMTVSMIAGLICTAVVGIFCAVYTELMAMAGLF